MVKRQSLAIRMVGFFLCFCLFGELARFLLLDDTQSYTRLMMHELRTEPVESLFVGSSHCYASLDPAVTSPLMGSACFNGGSSLQALDASYAVIREAAAFHRLKDVYLELYFKMTENDDYKSRTQMTGTYIIADYMVPSPWKLDFLLHAGGKEQYIHSFIPARRNWEKLTDVRYIRNVLEKKLTKDYFSYDPASVTFGEYGYRGRGFVAGDGAVENDLYYDSAGFDRIHVERVSADWLKTLWEIIRFCERKGIHLTLFSAPMADFQLVGAGNYDEYVSYVRDIAEEAGVPYVDFNLCRSEFLPLNSEHFADAGHLNAAGAALFSEVFASVFNGTLSTEDVFYEWYRDKADAMEQRLMGVSFQDEGEEIRNLKIVSTLPVGTLYQIRFSDGTATELSDEIMHAIPRDAHGTMEIQWVSPDEQVGSVWLDY